MSISIISLIGFAAWTLLLPLAQVSYRVLLVLSGKKPANSWTRGQPTDDPKIFERIGHAHLNCLENLPIFAVVILAAAATDQLAVTDPLAQWVLLLRLCQSTVHLIGVSHWLVSIRALFYTAQVAALFWMMAQLAL